jgi:hypothetical protein
MNIRVRPEQIRTERGGLEIAVEGFNGDAQEYPAQVFIEFYEGKLQIHIWDGSREDPIATHIIPRAKPSKK